MIKRKFLEKRFYNDKIEDLEKLRFINESANAVYLLKKSIDRGIDINIDLLNELQNIYRFGYFECGFMYVVLYWNLNKKIDELIVKELISFNYKPAIHFSNKFMGCNIENKSHVPDNLQKGNNVIYKKIPIIIKGALIAIIDPLDDRILSYDYDYLRRGLAPF